MGVLTERRLTERHVALYRTLWANAHHPGNGRRPIASLSQPRLAVALGCSTRTVRRYLADLRQPGPDVRHPGTAPAGMRLGYLTVYPQRRRHARGRGGYMLRDNRMVLNVELTALEARIRGECHHPVEIDALTAALVGAKSVDGALANGHVAGSPASGNGTRGGGEVRPVPPPAAPAAPAAGGPAKPAPVAAAAARPAPAAASSPVPPPRSSPAYPRWEQAEQARQLARLERWMREQDLVSSPVEVDRSPPPGRSPESWP